MDRSEMKRRLAAVAEDMHAKSKHMTPDMHRITAGVALVQSAYTVAGRIAVHMAEYAPAESLQLLEVLDSMVSVTDEFAQRLCHALNIKPEDVRAEVARMEEIALAGARAVVADAEREKGAQDEQAAEDSATREQREAAERAMQDTLRRAGSRAQPGSDDTIN